MFGLEVFLLIFLWSTQAQDVLTPSVDIIRELDKLRALERRMKAMEAEMAELKMMNEGLSRSLGIITKTITDQPKVAFSATLSNLQDGFKFLGPFQNTVTLVYENAFTNIGYAYDPQTGIFTAPLGGVYYFSFSLFHPVGPGPQAKTGASLVKNGVLVVAATDNAPGADSEDTSGNSASIRLEEGDQVYVQLWEKHRVYTDGNKRNTFSGHLLFPV
ncbi:complement C1q-like protein 3 isoform X2 [Pygocentrus nattereri]|uniref:complement C1q-like protein 3 isoform X2 n=1 Tax=Pygocentrus nattereri TaxID=42514 RepID=UPI00081474F1|nr:complement C1q-like protein 3 isoform X2 [Pygocentrus nattereri]